MIGKSRRKESKRRLDSVMGTIECEWNTMTKSKKVRQKSKMQQEAKENIVSVAHSPSQNNSSPLYQGPSTVDESSPPIPAFGPAPICRQFWKAGNYNIGEGSKAWHQKGANHLHVHPMFLHSNATSHKWALGAMAELLDNAIDEIRNGATSVVVDKTTNPRDGNPALLIQDDGGGMDPETIRRCMSFGFSEKETKCSIGQYGNGFKASSMRLGADVIVFTRHVKMRTVSQSIGLLSYTFLRQSGYDRIVVPLLDYEFNPSTEHLGPIFSFGKEHFLSNLSVLLQWSPYTTEEILLKQFDDIGHHGTKIVIYNLWLNDNGDTELDFDFHVEDIRVNADPRLLQTSSSGTSASDHHIANLYRFSLRVYSSFLYLRLPQNFKIILRGQVVEHHNVADDLKFPELILYKPFGLSKEDAVLTTIGFLKDAPLVKFHGFNVYHKNRLILPFWRVKHADNSTARGVVGILEANFIEPSHNKQDFEKTSIFQKLEARLKDMTMEYWRFHCGLIGYQLGKKTQTKPKPPQRSSASVDAQPVSPAVESLEAVGATPSCISTRKPEKSMNHHNFMSWQGQKEKRKRQNSTVELKNGKSHKAPDSNGNQLKEQEFTSLKEKNMELRSKLLEFERGEVDLNLKVQCLRRELGDLESGYLRMLAELGTIYD